MFDLYVSYRKFIYLYGRFWNSLLIYHILVSWLYIFWISIIPATSSPLLNVSIHEASNYTAILFSKTCIWMSPLNRVGWIVLSISPCFLHKNWFLLRHTASHQVWTFSESNLWNIVCVCPVVWKKSRGCPRWSKLVSSAFWVFWSNGIIQRIHQTDSFALSWSAGVVYLVSSAADF